MRNVILALSCIFFPFILNGQEKNNEAVIAAVNMNVLYRGVNNPVSIAVPGVKSEKISAQVTNGRISRTADGWDVSPGDQAETVITVFADNKKVTDRIFRVKAIPLPVAVLAGKSAGSLSRDVLMNAQTLDVELKDFLWELKFEISGFTFLTSKDGMDYEETVKGNRLNDKIRSYFSAGKSGQTFILKDIVAVGPDGRMMDLNPVILKIE